MQNRFHWHGLQRDVKDWFWQSEKCARRKSPLSTARAALVGSCPDHLFQRIALDIIEPMPNTESGNKYVLVVRDNFTKRRRSLFQTRKQRLWRRSSWQKSFPGNQSSTLWPVGSSMRLDLVCWRLTFHVWSPVWPPRFESYLFFHFLRSMMKWMHRQCNFLSVSCTKPFKPLWL